MATLDQLTITSSIETGKFVKDNKKLQAELTQTDQIIDGVAKRLGVDLKKSFTVAGVSLIAFDKALAGIQTVANTAINTLKNTWQEIDRIAESAQKLNISTTAFQQLSYAAGQLNTQASDVDGAMTKLQEHLGNPNEEFLNVIKEIGLNLTDLNGSSPDKAFNDVINGMKDVDNVYKRSSFLKSAFGKGGQKLNNLVDANYTATLNDTPVIDEQTTRNIDAANDAYARLQLSTQRVSGAFLGELAPGIEQFLKLLNQYVDEIDPSGISLFADEIFNLTTGVASLFAAMGQLTDRIIYMASYMVDGAPQQNTMARTAAGYAAGGIPGAIAARYLTVSPGNATGQALRESWKDGTYWDKKQAKIQEMLMNGRPPKGNGTPTERNNPYAGFQSTLMEHKFNVDEKLGTNQQASIFTSRLKFYQAELDANKKIDETERSKRQSELDAIKNLVSLVNLKDKLLALETKSLDFADENKKIQAQIDEGKSFNGNKYDIAKNYHDAKNGLNAGDKQSLLNATTKSLKEADALEASKKQLEASKMIWKWEDSITLLQNQRISGLTLTNRQLEIEQKLLDGISKSTYDELKAAERLLTIEERKAKIKAKGQIDIFAAAGDAFDIKKQFDPSLAIIEQKRKIDALFNQGLISESERTGSLAGVYRELQPEKKSPSLIRANTQASHELELRQQNGLSDKDALKEIERVEKENSKKFDETNRLLNQWLLRQKEEVISIDS